MCIVAQLNSKPPSRLSHWLFPWLHVLYISTSHLSRVMSDSWMIRSGRSSLTSPIDKLVPLHSSLPLFLPPPLNPPPLSPHHPHLLGSQLPLPLPLDGLCVTWVPLLLCLVSLRLDQPDPKTTPQAMLLICRYTLSGIARGLCIINETFCFLVVTCCISLWGLAL